MSNSGAALGGKGPGGRPDVAGPGFNRWFVPPAALAVHLCIGMAYGFSVFWLPLSHALGVKASIACPKLDPLHELANALTTTTCDWTVADLGWMYTLFFVVLGAAAALFGSWVERGPRRAGVVAALCWCGGLAISAWGVQIHQLWVLWLGSGLIGGVGLGLGYISPVSTLIKWFPDRRGLATGMAIMGFGGGAMIGGPLADLLMKHFATATSTGVAPTLLCMAAIYFVFMLAGALGYRVPAPGWRPRGWTPGADGPRGLRAGPDLGVGDAIRTPQFWLLWLVLLLNVSASIGIIGVASPMIQEIFGGRLFHHPEIAFASFSEADKKSAATVGAAFVGLISLFNIGGRFFWAALSDLIGRKATYATFFLLGGLLYAAGAPWAADTQLLAVFLATFCVIVSMYGGGFATVPAYLADLFGTRYVGAIHGVLLTSWSTAGVLGPVLVNYMRQGAIARGLTRAQTYDQIFWVLAALLAVGFLANLLIRPVAPQANGLDRRADETPLQMVGTETSPAAKVGPGLVAAWIVILIPIAWGVSITLTKAAALFH